MHGTTEYTVYPLTISELEQHINASTLDAIQPLGTIKLPSEFCCVCNSRNKPINGVDKGQYTIVDQWSGKIYTRVYDVNLSSKSMSVTISFLTFEGIKSGRKSISFICWPTKLTNQHLSTLVK